MLLKKDHLWPSLRFLRYPFLSQGHPRIFVSIAHFFPAVPTNSSALRPSAQDLRKELDGFIPNMTKRTGCSKASPRIRFWPHPFAGRFGLPGFFLFPWQLRFLTWSCMIRVQTISFVCRRNWWKTKLLSFDGRQNCQDQTHHSPAYAMPQLMTSWSLHCPRWFCGTRSLDSKKWLAHVKYFRYSIPSHWSSSGSTARRFWRVLKMQEWDDPS